MSGEKRCLRCQSILSDDSQVIRESFQKARSFDWKEQLTLRLSVLRHRLVQLSGWNKLNALPNSDGTYIPFRIPKVAGALTFVSPGLGQFYNRQRAKALVFGLLWWGGFAGAWATITHPQNNWFLAILFVAWCAIWTDAYITAARVNGQTLRPIYGLAVLFGILALLSFSVTTLQFFGASVYSLKTIFTQAGKPVIQPGDLILVSHLAYWRRPPRRGEVLQFNPSRFTVEFPGALTGNVLSINMTDYFQRVLAEAGDRVERRNGVLMVNGHPVPPQWDAFGADILGDHDEFTVPPGRVFAPITRIPSDTLGFIADGFGAPSVPHVGIGRGIFVGLQDANLPDRSQWLSRALFIVNPPPHRRAFSPKPH
jgi:signal peptidase I